MMIKMASPVLILSARCLNSMATLSKRAEFRNNSCCRVTFDSAVKLRRAHHVEADEIDNTPRRRYPSFIRDFPFRLP